MLLTPGFRYEFTTSFGVVNGVVASVDANVICLSNGRGLLARSVESLTPVFRDGDAFRAYSADKRKAYAKTGVAMKDGSYPIPDKGALKDAVEAYGRSPDESTKNHIVQRAKDLDATDQLPENWPGSTAGATTASAEMPETPETEVLSVREQVRRVYFSVASSE